MELSTFKFSYSTPLLQSVEAWFDGVNFPPNCTPVDDGVLIVFENPRLNVGPLSVHRRYTIKSPYFEKQERQINQVEQLNIEIVRAYIPTNPTQNQKLFRLLRRKKALS